MGSPNSQKTDVDPAVAAVLGETVFRDSDLSVTQRFRIIEGVIATCRPQLKYLGGLKPFSAWLNAEPGKHTPRSEMRLITCEPFYRGLPAGLTVNSLCLELWGNDDPSQCFEQMVLLTRTGFLFLFSRSYRIDTRDTRGPISPHEDVTLMAEYTHLGADALCRFLEEPGRLSQIVKALRTCVAGAEQQREQRLKEMGDLRTKLEQIYRRIR